LKKQLRQAGSVVVVVIELAAGGWGTLPEGALEGQSSFMGCINHLGNADLYENTGRTYFSP
jgi:hypothetical protein